MKSQRSSNFYVGQESDIIPSECAKVILLSLEWTTTDQSFLQGLLIKSISVMSEIDLLAEIS